MDQELNLEAQVVAWATEKQAVLRDCEADLINWGRISDDKKTEINNKILKILGLEAEAQIDLETAPSSYSNGSVLGTATINTNYLQSKEIRYVNVSLGGLKEKYGDRLNFYTILELNTANKEEFVRNKMLRQFVENLQKYKEGDSSPLQPIIDLLEESPSRVQSIDSLLIKDGGGAVLSVCTNDSEEFYLFKEGKLIKLKDEGGQWWPQRRDGLSHAVLSGVSDESYYIVSTGVGADSGIKHIYIVPKTGKTAKLEPMKEHEPSSVDYSLFSARAE